MNVIVPSSLIEESAEELYEHAPCGYLSFLPNGTIVKINQTLLNWLDCTAEEVLDSKKIFELFTVGGRIFYETHYAPLLRMQGHLDEVAFDFKSKYNETIPTLTSATLRVDRQGMPLIARMTVFNISDRKKYEKELLLERKKAEKAARAKADFLSMMSHEIRTPMNAVVGIVDLLATTSLTPQQNEYMEILKSSSSNLIGLLNSILDFSKIESGKVSLEARSFDLKLLLSECVEAFMGKAREKNLFLRLDPANDFPEFVTGDPIKLRQVLSNLIGNAVKFTKLGSINVKVLTKYRDEHHAIVNFAVTDTGIGIPADQIQTVFEEFTQAEYDTGTKYGGTGLGLAISQKLVELHGSKISVESEIGHGSTFTFDLHFKTALPLSHKEKIKPNSETLKGSKILIVDDNDDNIFLVTRLVSKWSVNFDIAKNGKEAVDRVTAHDYDLVLMDLRMPVLNGYEATKAIRALDDMQKKTVPIIALSASTKVGTEENVEFAAFDSVLGKPFHLDELFQVLVDHIRKTSHS